MAQPVPSPVNPIVEPATGGVTTPWYLFFVSLWNRTGAAEGNAASLSGDIKPYAGATAPTGWLVCDGSAVSRALYAALFAAIGVTWGSGDGSTTFNVPDLRGRMLLGAGGSYALGATGGAATTTLGVANLPAHSHGVTDPGHSHGVTDPGHVHGLPSNNGAGAVQTATYTAQAKVAVNSDSATTGVTVNSGATGITTTNTGSGTAATTISPYAVITYLIKT